MNQSVPAKGDVSTTTALNPAKNYSQCVWPDINGRVPIYGYNPSLLPP